jgi:hypothetical protein
MSKKQFSKTSTIYKDTLSSLSSWSPVCRNGWWIKFSTISTTNNILLLFVSGHTGQTIIKYFGNETDAVSYVSYVIENDCSVFLRENPETWD